MKLVNYLKDKALLLISYTVSLIIIFLIFRVFNTSIELIILVYIILIVSFITYILTDYLKRVKFYKKLINNINNMDKAYYVLATLESPDFYDGKILYDALYTINKSMIENVKALESQNEDFKEYIEMWIHDVKIPLAALSLMIHNNKNNFDKRILHQIKRINDCVEQVLYYARADNAEQDYIISDTKLDKVIKSTALNNKDELLDNKVDLVVENIDYEVKTDAKWLEFILNQIINNSIKYKREKGKSYIKIYAQKENDLIKLFIEDNGIGIPKEDIKRVFNKSFTGHNGREKAKSTGMGLYITKELCNKLGHDIKIESKQYEYTSICITFKINQFYSVVE